MKFNLLIAVFIVFLVVFPGKISAISNNFIDARIATYNVISGDSALKVTKGRFTAGVDMPAELPLLYGFPDAISTSHTTIKIEAPGNGLYIFGSDAGLFTVSPVTYTSFDAGNNSFTSCSWMVTGKKIEVMQEIKIVKNPRTARDNDTLQFKYTVANTNTFNAYVGVRVLLDTQLGSNDNSPITVDGYGRVTQGTKWTGSAVPESWISLDNMDNPLIKAEGYIKGPGATIPDQLIIGQWDDMKEGTSIWDPPVLQKDVTDTAVAVFWFPVTVTAGGEASFTTYYGLPDSSGAELSITKTVDAALAAYGDVLSYNISYMNTGNVELKGLYILDKLPASTTFLDASPGYVTVQAINDIYWSFPDDLLGPGGFYDVWCRVSLTARTGLTVDNRAAASYTDIYWEDMEVKYSNKVITTILTATITQTHTITPTHTVTPTGTVTPTSTNTPVALIAEFKGVYPNPASVDVKFIMKLSVQADVKVRIFTVSGESVVSIRKTCEEGHNAVLWGGKNSDSERAASGIYLYIIEVSTERDEKTSFTGKFCLLK